MMRRESLALGVFVLLVLALAVHALRAFGGRGSWPVLGVSLATVLFLAPLEARRGVGARAFPTLPRLGTIGSCLLLGALCLLVCLPTLRGDFFSDDFSVVHIYHARPLLGLLRVGDLSQDFYGERLDSWRPLAALYFRIAYLAFGTNPAGYHLANVLIHALCSCLVLLIGLEITKGRAHAAFFAGLLFAVAPVHTEPISWVTGNIDANATVFYLLAFLCFLRFRRTGRRRSYAVAFTSMGLGLLEKEILLTLPLVLLAWDGITSGLERSPRGRSFLPALVRAHAAFFGLAGSFVALRWLAFGSFAREGQLGLDTLRRFWAGEALRIRYLLTPFQGVAGFMGEHTEALDVRRQLLIGLTLGIVFVWSLVLLRRAGQSHGTLVQIAFFGVVWHAITIAPLLVTYASARHLYLPSAGATIAIAVLLFPNAPNVGDGLSVGRLLSAAFLVVAYASTLVRYNAEWLAAGAISRAARVGIARLATDLPQRSVVVLATIPGSYNHDPYRTWRGALPFALQPPFTARDLYADYQILEPPELYCCPPSKWWRQRAPIFRALGEGDAEQAVATYFLSLDPGAGRVVRRKLTVLRGPLRARIAALPGGLAGPAIADEAAAYRLLGTLFKDRNSLEFRGEEPPQQPSRHPRILAVGGSTTASDRLSLEQTWPDKLERKVAGSFPGVWSNNAGLAGAGTREHLELLTERLVKLRPDVALFLVGLERDELFGDDGASTLDEALDLRRRPRLAYAGKRPEKLLDPLVERELPAYRSRLAEIVRTCRSADIEPVFLTQPALYGPGRDEVTGVDLGATVVNAAERINGDLAWRGLELFNEATRALAADRGVLVVDLARQLPKSSRLFHDFVHLSEEGSREVAELVWRRLCPLLASRLPHELASPCPRPLPPIAQAGSGRAVTRGPVAAQPRPHPARLRSSGGREEE